MDPESPLHSPNDAIPVSPALESNIEALGKLPEPPIVDRRTVYLCLLAVAIGLCATLIAQAMTALIGLITNLAFYGRFSVAFDSPAGNHLGLWVIAIPVVGGLIVGLMARFGSEAIRGHGIPEAMQQIAFHRSKIAPRITFLKPVSSAIAIGTGGPFGAEGPIIATGGALGSLVGQLLHITDDERKVLLASGAAAGMAAIFLSPVSAVLLAIELLLFEYRPRSVIPVALASVTATGFAVALHGNMPVFAMPEIQAPEFKALLGYILLGVALGFVAVLITKAVYYVEELFEKLPIHWMWWPMLGAVAVGIIGFFVPRTLGVGYDNIQDILSGTMAMKVVAILLAFKFLSWVIALGSGTSGGTLAPLMTIGGGLGAVFGDWLNRLVPHWGLDIRISALVGMAALFAGASRAFLASVVFAFETTRQTMGLLPLLGACSAAYLVSCLCMRHSIMTEKLARRGTPISTEYSVDSLSRERVRDWAVSKPDAVMKKVRQRNYPVIDEASSLREAVHLMVKYKVGRLLVVSRTSPGMPSKLISRANILAAFEPTLKSSGERQRMIRLKIARRKHQSVV